MKIGIYLEGSPEMGGGSFQSIKSSLLLLDIKEHNQKIDHCNYPLVFLNLLRLY